MTRGFDMAELTHLEEKLAEVTGLAMAAEAAGGKVTKLTEEQDQDLVKTLQKMAKEAAETAERCEEVAGTFEGKKTAILDEAREVKKKAAEMMSTYLDRDADALDGFEFLTMAEAAEVGHWSVLQTLNESAGNERVRDLVSWALPIQERHFQNVLEGSRKLAAEEDPNETA
jgi:coenzyme F420-reducing hydrogenase alpha subunit